MKYLSAYYYPKKLREEFITVYLTGENSYEELGEYYKVKSATIQK